MIGLKKRILVAEDEFSVASVLGDFLTEEGYEVTVAHHGTAAMQAVESRDDFDLVLVDLFLPETPGLIIAARAAERDTPVLLTSGRPEAVAAATRLGVDLLVKPYYLGDLLDAVQRNIVLSRSQIRRARAELARLRENIRLLREELDRRR